MPMRWEREWIGTPVLPAPARRNPIVARIAQVREPRKRAMMLLEEYLTDYQVRDLRRNLGFNIRGSDKRLYRIFRLNEDAALLVCHGTRPITIPESTLRRSHIWNNVIDDTFHARGCWSYRAYDLPEGDVLLAQKLLIEGNARYFQSEACGYSIMRNSVPLHSYGGMI